MARKQDKETARTLRKQGMSYSEIRERLDVSKSTLSVWLRDMPLSEKRINELRARAPRRIERFRATMKAKKDARRTEVFSKVAKDIEDSTNTSFVAGFYLYWGEGTKTAEYTVSLTNSDPSMMQAFIQWLDLLGVDRTRLKVKLHLYIDQNEEQVKKKWAVALTIPLRNFNRSYIKDSYSYRKTYKGMFPYGTCVVTYHNRDLYEYVLAGVKYLQKKHMIAGKTEMG